MDNDTAQLNDTKVGVDSKVSPSPSENINGNSVSSDGRTQDVKPSILPENQPIEKHPQFQGLLRDVRDERKARKQLESQIAEMRGFQEAMRRQPNQSQQGIDPDKENALDQLFDLALQSPRVMQRLTEKLGLNKIQDIEKQVGELSSSWYGSQANSEMDKIKEYATSIGLNPDDVEDSVKGAIEDDPIYSQISYRPGAYRSVFNNLYFEKAGEFRERAENTKKIKEREALKRGQTQISSDSQTRPGAKAGDLDQRFMETIRQGIDFTS